jgi:hypothetical protein
MFPVQDEKGKWLKCRVRSPVIKSHRGPQWNRTQLKLKAPETARESRTTAVYLTTDRIYVDSPVRFQSYGAEISYCLVTWEPQRYHSTTRLCNSTVNEPTVGGWHPSPVQYATLDNRWLI